MKISLAGADIKTGEIFGCKEYSKQWWHEKGHLEHQKNETWKTIEMLNGYILILVLAFLVMEANFLAAILLLSYVFIDMYDELWASWYMHKHKSEWK